MDDTTAGPAEPHFDQELLFDERLLWAGRPRQGLLLRASDVLAIPFSFMWGGFALFWEYEVFNTKAPVFMLLWGLPFVAIGLYMMVGRFFADSLRRARTYYGLTNQRVIILVKGGTRKTVAIPLEQLGGMQLQERQDGTGDIVFGSLASPNALGMAAQRQRSVALPTFELIADVRNVYNRITEAQRLKAKIPAARNESG
jgi:hypothetical protein